MPVNPAVFAAQQRFARQKAAQAAMAQQSRGGQAQGGRGVTVGPVGMIQAGRQQAKATKTANSAQWQQAKEEAKAVGHAQQGPGGIGGFVGNILSNPIVSTVLKPMQVLSYGKNAIQTGVLELEELLTERENTPHWARFLTAKPEQLNWFTPADEVRAGRSNIDLILGREGEYKGEKKGPIGFGSMVQDIPDFNIGPVNVGKIADVGIGFAGDVALDPLTYGTAGMNKIPGAVGRIQLAAQAERLGLSEDVVRAAGRYGARGVRGVGDEAAIKALELPKPGIRFGGVGGHEGLRIPGTGKVGELVDLGLQKTRSPFTDTTLGRGARRLGAARYPATRAAVESLVTGGNITPSVAAGHIATEWGAQAAARELTGALENTARDIAKKAKDDPALTHALETGDLSNPVVEAWHKMNQQVRQRQLDAGVSVGELADPELNWAPRIVTKEGEKVFEHATSSVPGVQGIGPESQQFKRVFEKGKTYKIMGKKFSPVTNTIKEANDWGLKELGIKLYEDSPAKLSAYAVESASDAVGKVAKLKGLFDSSSQKLFGKTDKRVSYVDEALTRAASKETGGELADVLEPILRDITQGEARLAGTGQAVDEAGQMLQSFERGAGKAQRSAYGEAYGAANAAEAEYASAARAAPDVSSQLDQLLPQLEQARAAEAAAQRPVDQLSELASQSVQGPRALAPEVQQELSRLQGVYDEFDAQRLAAAPGSKAERQALGQMVAAKRQMDALPQRFSTAVEAAPLPEAAPFQEALQEASGARQSLEEQLAPLQAQQAAREGLGAPPNVDEMVAQQVQPRMEELAMTRSAFVQHRTATEMSDLMAEAALGTPERQLQEQIAHLPEPARALIEVTMKGDRSEVAMGKLLGDIRQGKLDDQIVRQANEGYELLRTDRLMGRDTIIDSEMKRVMDESDEAMRKFNEVARKDPGLLGKVIDEYTKFFKAWATATPGFHVRNAMSATFMNMSEGVTFKEMLDGNLIWKTWRRYGGGSELARRASRQLAPDVEWVKYLPERLRGVAPDVVKAVYASGAGGRYTAAELGERAFGEVAEGGRVASALRKTYENVATEVSHNVGEHIEGRVRSGLALHALRPDGSGSWAEAVQRIKRVHFDYSDVNELDRGLKRIIPFWTFMSRNLPLQVQQMWTAPRAYSHYQSLMNNINADPEGDMLMPDWLQRTGAVFLNKGGLALNPDIGPSQIETSLGQIADPKSLLSNVNPIFKTPLQLATNQNFFYGNQYKENDYQQPGWETAIPSQLLAAIGVGKHTRNGVVQERKILDAIGDLVPLSGQANRLTSSTEDREGKGLASQLGYIGIPLRQVDQDKEARNNAYATRQRRREQQDQLQALARFNGAA